jgi:hypothetical protein
LLTVSQTKERVVDLEEDLASVQTSFEKYKRRAAVAMRKAQQERKTEGGNGSSGGSDVGGTGANRGAGGELAVRQDQDQDAMMIAKLTAEVAKTEAKVDEEAGENLKLKQQVQGAVRSEAVCLNCFDAIVAVTWSMLLCTQHVLFCV